MSFKLEILWPMDSNQTVLLNCIGKFSLTTTNQCDINRIPVICYHRVPGDGIYLPNYVYCNKQKLIYFLEHLYDY